MISPDQWIERYRRAWETGDSDEVVDLFTPAAAGAGEVLRAVARFTAIT